VFGGRSKVKSHVFSQASKTHLRPPTKRDIPICRVTLLRDLSPAGQQVSNGQQQVHWK
jgi:hypothetical protein